MSLTVHPVPVPTQFRFRSRPSAEDSPSLPGYPWATLVPEKKHSPTPPLFHSFRAHVHSDTSRTHTRARADSVGEGGSRPHF